MKQVTCPSCGYKTPKGAGEGEKTGIQVSGEVHRRLVKRKELLEAQRGNTATLSEVIEELLESTKIPGTGEEDVGEVREFLQKLEKLTESKRNQK